jgi:putative mycofactocin binding protein MftB
VDLGTPLRLHPQVVLRPLSFGALAYHYGTRRLSFLKSRLLLEVVERLGESPDAGAACRAAGVAEAELPAYRRALATLAASGMIVPREASGTLGTFRAKPNSRSTVSPSRCRCRSS